MSKSVQVYLGPSGVGVCPGPPRSARFGPVPSGSVQHVKRNKNKKGGMVAFFTKVNMMQRQGSRGHHNIMAA